MGGAIFYDYNIEDCYDKREMIVEELKNIFVNAEITGPKTLIQDADKTGKSKTYHYARNFPNGDMINVQCYIFSV